VAPADVTARPEGRAIAGWEQLVMELPAGDDGLRVLIVVVDAHDRVIAASDAVLHRVERADNGVGGGGGRPDAARDAVVVEYRHESLGGRFEEDGSFRGTRWLVVAADDADEGTPPLDSATSTPSDEEVRTLRALVEEVVRRAPARAT
jgi:hypothetical protein